MRFHSIVLQTLLNGNNYILDYTQPKKGKIIGFINDIDKAHFFTDRYIQLQELNREIIFLFNNKSFHYDIEKLRIKVLNKYLDGL